MIKRLIWFIPLILSAQAANSGLIVTFPLTALPAAAPDNPAVTFNVYRSATSGGPYVLAGSGNITSGSATFVDGCAITQPAPGCFNYVPGSTWFYVFTGVNPASSTIVNTRTNNPQESTDSPEQAVTFPSQTKTIGVSVGKAVITTH